MEKGIKVKGSISVNEIGGGTRMVEILEGEHYCQRNCQVGRPFIWDIYS